MDGYINLLGVTISLDNAKTALEKTRMFLGSQGRHVIRFVDTKACTLASEDAECARMIGDSDYVLPADLSTEQGIKELIDGYREVFWHREYFDALFGWAAENGQEIYFVTSTEKEYTDIAETVKTRFPYLSLHGKAIETLGDAAGYDVLANDINSVAPTILFFYTNVKLQNDLMQECGGLLNAALIICGIGMLEDVITERKTTPEEDAPLKEKFSARTVNFLKRIHTTMVGEVFKNRVKNSRKDEQDGDVQ